MLQMLKSMDFINHLYSPEDNELFQRASIQKVHSLEGYLRSQINTRLSLLLPRLATRHQWHEHILLRRAASALPAAITLQHNIYTPL